MSEGRRKRYRVAKAEAEVKLRQTRDENSRRKRSQRETQPILYEPASPRTQIASCPGPDLGVSPEVLVTQGPLVQLNGLPEGEDVCRPPSRLAPPVEGDVEAAVVRSPPREKGKEQVEGHKTSSRNRPLGRPRKYLTAEARAEAKRKWCREEYLRRKNRSFQRAARPDFIHYEPTPLDVPTITPLDLGLRISADVPIPRDPLIQPDELLENKDAHRPQPAVSNVETVAVSSQLQESETERSSEHTVSSSNVPRRTWPLVNRQEKRAEQRALGLVSPKLGQSRAPIFTIGDNPDRSPFQSNVPLPRHRLPQPNEVREGANIYRRQLAANDIEAATVLSQLRGSEKDQTSERSGSERQILQRTKNIDARTLGMLLDMQADIARLHTSMKRILDHVGIVERLVERTN